MIYQYKLFMFCFEGRNYLSGFKYMYSRGCFKEHLSCYYLGWTQDTFLPVLKYPVTFGPFWGTAYPSPKPVWECNVLLKQNTLKSQSLSLEWRFPSLKSYPSSCFLLFSLMSAVWTLAALISPGILSWNFPGLLCPIPGQIVWDQPYPEASKLELLLWPSLCKLHFVGDSCILH